MTAKSTRSTIDLTQTTINSLLLSTKQEKNASTSMENSQQLNIDSEEQQLDINKSDEKCKDINTYARGHELNDQRINSDDQQQTSNQLVFNAIQKYDGNSDPQQWLKYILAKFDLLQIPLKDRHHFIPDILTGDAFLWYVRYQEHMPTFLTFTKQLLQDYPYQEQKTAILQTNVLSAVSVKQTDTVVQTENVMDCLRNQMLITNLQKLSKFSGKSQQNVSKWIQEIQQTMNMFKLSESEKLFYISLCLEGIARDWFYDNLHLCSTWTLFIQLLLTTFESSGKADISFNRLRHYEQSLNQNVRQYYFDIMKLCKEANPLMDDATKLQYLKDGLKPSLRFDVLLKNPQTTKEFLEYAQRIEELKSLDDQNDTTSYVNERSTSISTCTTPNSTNNVPQQASQPTQPRQNTFKNTQTKSNNNTPFANHYSQQTTPSHVQNNNNIPKPPYQCYNCGGYDHYIRSCPHFQ